MTSRTILPVDGYPPRPRPAVSRRARGGVRHDSAARCIPWPGHIDRRGIDRLSPYTSQSSNPDRSRLHDPLWSIGRSCKHVEIRCQFIILARKDELTPDFPASSLAGG